MKNLLTLTFLFFLTAKSWSQEIPQIKISDTEIMGVSKLDVKTEIVGNIAVTTYDMLFYNGSARVLEGDFTFPLGQEQKVTGFAMEVNGALRKAVVVEKNLGQRAFENTVRQEIDPGLLVKTEGNNHKARIYPILPKAYKRVVITYEEQLAGDEANYVYELPLALNKKYESLEIDIKVSGSEQNPVFRNNARTNYLFQKVDGGYEFEFSKDVISVDQKLTVVIPRTVTKQQLNTYEDYFLLNLPLDIDKMLRAKSKSITLLWDASLSTAYRDIDKELKLINEYLNYLSEVTVDVVVFSNTIKEQRRFEVRKSSIKNLTSFLKSVYYDGGTSTAALDDLKLKSDEVLLFSDGLVNLGKGNYSDRTALYTINSVVKANHDYLEREALESGGSYVNINRLSTVQALEKLKFKTLLFLGVEKTSLLEEVYPSKKKEVYHDFTITGKFKNEGQKITVTFGYKNKVMKRLTVPIKKTSGGTIVKKLWAQEKLKELIQKDVIITHAKAHQLITEYTSLIILDRVEDYVKYKIDPPAELIKDYKVVLENAKEAERALAEILLERKNSLKSDYEGLMTWYNQDFKPKKQETSSSDGVLLQSATQNPSREVRVRGVSSTSDILNGRVEEVQVEELEEVVSIGSPSESKKLKANTTHKGTGLKGWDPETPYLKILESKTTLEEAYLSYLDLRKTYGNAPTFYLDVASFFDSQGDEEKAIRIATNLLELDLGNYELLRALAYFLESIGQDEDAVFIYEKVIQLRPEEPQSFRDLGLALRRLGMKNRSDILLQNIIDGAYLKYDEGSRFKGIETIAYLEKTSQQGKDDFFNETIDIRIVIDWNHNDTDIDLWVTDPTGEKAFYQNKLTVLGGECLMI